MSVIDAIDDPVEVWSPRPPGELKLARLTRELAGAEAEIERLQAALVEAERLADHDPLTGLVNRRAFDRELTRRLADCRRYGIETALVYFDLDGFKAVNDQHGHAAGDTVLKIVAEALNAGVREGDLVARLGGDEFAVILGHAGRKVANAKAQSLVAAIEGVTAAPGGPIRVSYGVRTFEPGLQAPQILAEADAAMFVRKGGRGRG
jgi:diguanylate cyclase (GGDEF)-like protein